MKRDHESDPPTAAVEHLRMMARGKKSVAPEPKMERHAPEAYWHPQDATERDLGLKRLLSCEYDGFIAQLAQTYDPLIGPLLCMPREQVQGRMHNIVSGAAMVYGLILSGVAGSALSPLEAQAYADSRVERTLANFYNLAATVQFTICVLGSLWTTFVLGFLNCQPDTTILRCAANFGFFTKYFGLIGWSSLLLLAQCAVIIYLRSDSEWAFVTVGLIVFIFLGFVHHWAYGVKKAMPELAVHMYPTLLMASFGSPFIVRWFFTKKEDRKLAEHAAHIMIQEAENNFGKPVVNRVRRQLASEHADEAAGMTSPPRDDEDPDTTSSSDVSGIKSQELKALITQALPDASADRCENLVMGMLIEELTVPILVAMASRPLGLHMIDVALRENNMRMQLLTGERMAIVEAVANMAAKCCTDAGAQDRWPSTHVSGSSFGCGDVAHARRLQKWEQGKELCEKRALDAETLQHLQQNHPSSSASGAASVVADSVISYWDHIEKAGELFDKGLITREEHDALKQTCVTSWLKKLKET